MKMTHLKAREIHEMSDEARAKRLIELREMKSEDAKQEEE